MDVDDGPPVPSGESEALDDEIRRLHDERQDLTGDLRQPDDGPAAARAVLENELLAGTLEGDGLDDRRRRDRDPDDEALRGSEDDRSTVPHEGRGEDMDPAATPDEWTAARGDQITEAAAVDDPVEALEIGSLWAGTEAEATGDATELADGAAPPVPEEEAVVDDAGDPADAEALSTGLEPGIDLDRLDEISDEDLIEAELVAIDEGDPEAAAMIAAEIEQRRPQ